MGGREQFIPLKAVKPAGWRRPPIEVSDFRERDIPGKEVGEELIRLGLMTGAGVVQGDIAVSRNLKSGEQQGLCDHNCAKEGGYSCPARRSVNGGLTTKGLAPADQLINGFLTGAEGIRTFNRRFVAGSLKEYGRKFNIPADLQEGIAYNLLKGKIMANIFGGNAEMHPEALKIAEQCHEAGLRTTLTTTSGILLLDSPRGEAFFQGLLSGHVDVLAVTAEFKNAEHVSRLAAMKREQLKAELRGTSYYAGQARKGIEAVNAAHMQEEQGGKFPQVLMNLVVHPGILDEVEEIIGTVKQEFPGVKVNPYPAQSSFSGEPPVFSEQHVPLLTQFIDRRLAEQQAFDPQVVLRPQYYAMLKAVTETHPDDPKRVAEMLSGYGVWNCYKNPYELNGSGGVVQFGAPSYPISLEMAPDAGGYLDCFWNHTTTTRNDKQIWNMRPAEVSAHINGGMHSIAEAVEHPCDGCNMPRLTDAIHVQELGLNPALKPAYLRNRSEAVGF